MSFERNRLVADELRPRLAVHTLHHYPWCRFTAAERVHLVVNGTLGAGDKALFAESESGSSVELVTLADGFNVRRGSARWAKDDSFISFIAGVEDGNGDETVHIVWAPISFGNDGLPALEAEPVTVVDESASGSIRFDQTREGHDWSPGGDALAYAEESAGGTSLRVASFDLSSGTPVLNEMVILVSDYDEDGAPWWSPEPR